MDVYTVKLGWFDQRSDVTHRGSFVVEANSYPEAFDRAKQALVTKLIIEATSVQPWCIEYERGGDRRIWPS